MPVFRRVFGASHEGTVRMNKMYAEALYKDPAATLDDLREAVTTLEDTARIARRVFGGAHPIARWIESGLRDARIVLRFLETGETPSPAGGLG